MCKITIFKNICKCFLEPKIWSVLVKVFFTLNKYVYYKLWDDTYNKYNSDKVVEGVLTFIPLLTFCLVFLTNTLCQVSTPDFYLFHSPVPSNTCCCS